MFSLPVPSWRDWLIRADRCSQHKHKGTAIDDYMCQAHKNIYKIDPSLEKRDKVRRCGKKKTKEIYKAVMLRKNTVKQIFMVCSKNLSNQRESMRAAVWVFVHSVVWKLKATEVS